MYVGLLHAWYCTPHDKGHKKKGSKFKGGGGGGLTHFFLTSKKISPKKQKKKKRSQSAHSWGALCSFEGLLITFGVSPGSGTDPPKSECNKIWSAQSHRAPRSAQLSSSLRPLHYNTHCNVACAWSRGGHSQTNVLPTRVQTPQKLTLNGVLRHIKFAPLNGITPVKHNLNGYHGRHIPY